MTSPPVPDSASTPTSRPAPRPVILPEHPSLMWRKLWGIGVLAPGAALPLKLLFYLPPPEVNLFFSMGLARRYASWRRQLPKAVQATKERKGEPVSGLTGEEADIIRAQRVSTLRSLLRIWGPHYEESGALARLADERGYFEVLPPE